MTQFSKLIWRENCVSNEAVIMSLGDIGSGGGGNGTPPNKFTPTLLNFVNVLVI